MIFLLSSIPIKKITLNRRIYVADYSTIVIQMETYADKNDDIALYCHEKRVKQYSYVE